MANAPEATETGRPLKVGYVSTSFYSCPGARFFLPVLDNHSAHAVETYLYATGGLQDAETRRMRKLAAHWRDLSKMPLKVAVGTIREDAVDILVDMDGHSRGSRLMIFACRCAPVQLSYHGAFASSGLDTMDYRLADSVLCPPGELPSGPEQLVRMRGCFYAYSPWPDAPDVTLSPARRNGYVTFGIMHRVQKWTPLNLDLWCRVLKALPSSRVLVNAHDARQFDVADLAAPFANRGVDRARVIVPPRAATTADYLRLYDQVDIFLDAFPFSGATTVADALWQGVPVVTLRGQSFLGRMSASILSGAGCAQWVANIKGDYISTARELALDTGGLAYTRNALRGRLWQSALMDGAAVARELERTYQNLWAWHRARPAIETGVNRGEETSTRE